MPGPLASEVAMPSLLADLPICQNFGAKSTGNQRIASFDEISVAHRSPFIHTQAKAFRALRCSTSVHPWEIRTVSPAGLPVIPLDSLTFPPCSLASVHLRHVRLRPDTRSLPATLLPRCQLLSFRRPPADAATICSRAATRAPHNGCGSLRRRA